MLVFGNFGSGHSLRVLVKGDFGAVLESVLKTVLEAWGWLSSRLSLLEELG